MGTFSIAPSKAHLQFSVPEVFFLVLFFFFPLTAAAISGSAVPGKSNIPNFHRAAQNHYTKITVTQPGQYSNIIMEQDLSVDIQKNLF